MITACSNKRELNSQYYCKKLKLNCIRENQKITFKTSKGIFDVNLDAESHPLTVTNFLENIKNDVYTNQRFYKIINYPQIKIMHAGIFKEKNKFLEKNKLLIKKPISIPLEVGLKNKLEPKYKYQIKDPAEIGEIKNLFQKGSLAMVRSGEKISSSTEFFLVTNNIPELDGRYSNFGQVVRGFEVLEKINNKDLIYEIKISN